MKKLLPLTVLLLLVISSCKKDGSSTFPVNDDVKATTSNSSYYKIGTVLPSPDKSATLNIDGFKVSYTWFIPEPMDGSVHPEGALGGYPLNKEVARSVNGLYSLFFQSDGNLVLYKRSSANGPLVTGALWATNAYLPSSPPSSSNVTPRTDVQTDGNIVCKGLTGNIYWASNITASPKPIWILQDDGNFVGYSNFENHGSAGITITGAAFAATFTDGGRTSNIFGKMGKA